MAFVLCKVSAQEAVACKTNLSEHDATTINIDEGSIRL